MKQTYKVTPEEMASFRELAAKNGLNIPPGNSGEVLTHGIVMDFAYDGTTNLTLTITSKPFYIPASMVWDEIAKFLPAPEQN